MLQTCRVFRLLNHCVHLQGCSYSCVVATPDSKSLFVVGSDKKLKELEEVGGTGTQVTKELDTGVLVNSIALPAGEPALRAVHALLILPCLAACAQACYACYDTCASCSVCSALLNSAAKLGFAECFAYHHVSHHIAVGSARSALYMSFAMMLVVQHVPFKPILT